MITQTAVTLDNLQAAFNGESNARSRYLAFAEKADQEGYAQVARLFRAAARAEEIHAANHSQVIRKTGAMPVASLEKINVRSTRENLQEAIKGEVYERDVMYPEFLSHAKAEANGAAVRSILLALTVEAEHVVLFNRALAELESWRTASQSYFVCPVCGSTQEALNMDRCPVCLAPKNRFEEIR